MRRLFMLAATAVILSNGAASADIRLPPRTVSTKAVPGSDYAPDTASRGSTLLAGIAISLAVVSTGVFAIRRTRRTNM